MKIALIVSAALAALVLVGAAIASSAGGVVKVHPGDKILTSNGVACSVSTSSIACSSAKYKKVVVVAAPNGNASIAVDGKVKLICLRSGACSK